MGDPVGEGLFDGGFDGLDGNAGGFDFVGVHDAVGAGCLGRSFKKRVFRFEKLEGFAWGDAAFFNPLGDLAGGDTAGVGNVVDPGLQLLFPGLVGYGDKFLKLGDRVFGIEEFFVTEEFGEVVAGVIAVVKGDAETPDIAVFRPMEDFLAQGFGTAVPGAIVLAEGKVGWVGF